MARHGSTLLVHFGGVLALLGASAWAAYAAPPPNAKAPPAQTAATNAVGRHAFTVDDLLAMDRLRVLDVSPDGKHVVFTISSTDLAANERSSART
jgi:acylaminoacyl-peptidase